MRKIIAVVLIVTVLAVGNSIYIKKDVRAADQEKYEFVTPTEANREEISDEKSEVQEACKEESFATEVIVPIYNYDVSSIVVPTSYALSLNPYELPIDIGSGSVSTKQVLSREYGIINKSSTDKVITMTLTVEDLNKGKITFVDSMEEVQKADKDAYAVYLSMIPADESEVTVDGTKIDVDTLATDISDVKMAGAKKQAIALHEGENKIRFKLSKAVYDFSDGDRPTLDGTELENSGKTVEAASLDPNGGSVTAFTFGGGLDKKAEWGKLTKGLKITAVYEYGTAEGDEQIVKGTGAMINDD